MLRRVEYPVKVNAYENTAGYQTQRLEKEAGLVFRVLSVSELLTPKGVDMYFGGGRSIRVKRDYKKDIPKLSKIDDLGLKDLKKVKQFLETYPDKIAQHREDNKKNQAENERCKEINDDRYRKWLSESKSLSARHDAQYLDPIEKIIDSLKLELENYKVSVFGAFLASDVTTSRALGTTHKFEGHRAREIIAQIEALWDKRRSVLLAKPTLPKPVELPVLPIKPKPKEYTVLTISGSKVRVFYSDFTLETVDRLIDQAESKVRKEQQKLQEIKARANRIESDVRNQAKQYMKGLSDQLNKVDGCPYCSGELKSTNFHQDHIYPVSKGGLSTPGNLVFVCMSCNLKKSDKTLRVFLKEQKFDSETVYVRLETLGKQC